MKHAEIPFLLGILVYIENLDIIAESVDIPFSALVYFFIVGIVSMFFTG